MPRLLFVTLESPWPPNRGGRQRSNLLHRALSQCGDVDLLLISDNDYSREERDEMRTRFGLLAQIRPTPRGQLGGWNYLRPLAPKLIDRLAHNFGRRSAAYAPDPAVTTWIRQNVKLGDYDVLVARYVFALTRCGLAGKCRTILDVDDLITSVYRYRLEVSGQRPWQRAMLARHLRQHEGQLPRVFQHCERLWIANEDDRRECHVTKSTSPNFVRVLPNIPWSPPEETARAGSMAKTAIAPAGSKTIITVGSLNYGANVHGVSQFVDHVWPRIRAAVPDAQFLIVGNGMTDAMRSNWGRIPGVRPMGYVDDVGPSYAESAFAVAPVFYGGGTNIKVLEAFHYGRTCVVTAQAHRGYGAHLKHQESLFVAASLEQFADGCVQLLLSPESAQRWSDTGKRMIDEYYSWQRFQEIVVQTVGEVLQP